MLVTDNIKDNRNILKFQNIDYYCPKCQLPQILFQEKDKNLVEFDTT